MARRFTHNSAASNSVLASVSSSYVLERTMLKDLLHTRSNDACISTGKKEHLFIHSFFQVTISAKAEVTVDEFFKKNLIENLANLLGCDISQIRFMKVISASKRRRRATSSSDVQLVLQIANNPAPTIDTGTNTTNTTQTVSQNTTGKGKTKITKNEKSLNT